MIRFVSFALTISSLALVLGTSGCSSCAEKSESTGQENSASTTGVNPKLRTLTETRGIGGAHAALAAQSASVGASAAPPASAAPSNAPSASASAAASAAPTPDKTKSH